MQCNALVCFPRSVPHDLLLHIFIDRIGWDGRETDTEQRDGYGSEWVSAVLAVIIVAALSHRAHRSLPAKTRSLNKIMVHRTEITLNQQIRGPSPAQHNLSLKLISLITANIYHRIESKRCIHLQKPSLRYKHEINGVIKSVCVVTGTKWAQTIMNK